MRTERTSTLPPFFTQVIGSLPRPKLVRDLLARRRDMAADQWRGLMDDMVAFAIRLQEQAGLDVVSDGEWRRSHYIGELLERIGGFEPARTFEHQGETRRGLVVTGRMQAAAPVFVEDARFLVRHTDRRTKFALPSPFLVGARYWDPDHSRGAYPTVQHFTEHLAVLLAAEARALAEVGIDIIQLDDPALTYFCDRRLMEAGESHDARLRRQWDPERQVPEAIACINRIAEGLPAEVHLHCCHSVYRRRSDVMGNYEPILPRLGDARVDRVNIEFAYHGTGDINDLRLLPGHLAVGMGVIDVRGARVQTVAEVEALGSAGAQILDPARIALNPDCGFAPDAGEPPTIDEAYEKLCRLCEASRRLRSRTASADPQAATPDGDPAV